MTCVLLCLVLKIFWSCWFVLSGVLTRGVAVLCAHSTTHSHARMCTTAADYEGENVVISLFGGCLVVRLGGSISREEKDEEDGREKE